MTFNHITPSPLVFNGEVIRDRPDQLCLTDMWKAAGSDPARQPSNWIASAEASRFVEFLSEVLIPGNSGNDLVKVTRGGRTPGTWAHWQIGLAYAKYLSPEFHMWCNQVVRERMEGKRSPTAVSVNDLAAEVRSAIGGIVKGVVHKELAEIIPALIRGEMASQTMMFRHGKTAGQIWHANGFPKIKVTSWFGNRLAEMGCRIDGNGRGEMGLTRARLFDPDKAETWLKNGGMELVKAKIAERMGQGRLRLVVGQPS